MRFSKILFFSAILIIFLYVGTSIGTPDKNCTITIDAARKVTQYNPLILGSNLNWINNADGIYSPAAERVSSDVERIIKNMGVKVLRFPGGTLSEFYDWKSGIGPASKRGNGFDYGKKAQRMYFGVDEFLRYCEASGIIPVFTVGYANNTPVTAAEIVEYCNGAVSTSFGALRARNGHSAPYGVKFWEIGNEVYHKGISAENATAYGKKVAEMATVMKKIDPTIRIGAIGLGCSKLWDESVMRECAQKIDFLVYHRYFPNTFSDDQEATNNAIIASTGKMSREIRRLQETAAEYNPKLTVAVTEYNLDFRDAAGKNINKQSDIQQALFIAECMRLFQITNVSFATKWDLAHFSKHYMSDINFNRGSKVSLAPTYYAQQVYAKAGMQTLVDVQTNSPTVSILSFGEIKNESNAPVLTAIAGKDRSERVLSVIVINRDMRNSLKAKMEIRNVGLIRKIDLITMKAPSSGPADHFIMENATLLPAAIKSLVIPAGSISLFKISI